MLYVSAEEDEEVFRGNCLLWAGMGYLRQGGVGLEWICTFRGAASTGLPGFSSVQTLGRDGMDMVWLVLWDTLAEAITYPGPHL